MFSNRKKIKLQGKTKSHKDALIRSQIIELIRAKRIKTTPSKAKATKAVFDRLVTKAKKVEKKSNNYVKSFFNNNARAIDRLYSVIDEHLHDRNSGYTRIIKTLPRKGDNAEQAYIMLVNYEVGEKASKIQEVLQEQREKKNKKKNKKSSTKTKKVESKKSN